MGWGASFVGLHAYGQGQMVGFSYWTAWLVPGTFDGAAFGATLITYRASIYGRSAMRGRLLMWSFTGISSWINWIHQVSPEAQIVAAGLPIAAVAVFDVVLAEMRADFEERHGKRRLRLRPGLLALRWIVDRTGTSGAFRQQVTDIPVSEIAGLASQNMEDPRSVFEGGPPVTAMEDPEHQEQDASHPVAEPQTAVSSVSPDSKTPGERTSALQASGSHSPSTQAGNARTSSARTAPTQTGSTQTGSTQPASTQPSWANGSGGQPPNAQPPMPERPAAQSPATQVSATQVPGTSRSGQEHDEQKPAAQTSARHPDARSQMPSAFAEQSAHPSRPVGSSSDQQDRIDHEQERSGGDHADSAREDAEPTGSAAAAADAPTVMLPPVPASPLSELSDEDKRTFARRDYRLSLDTGSPLTGADLGRRYGYSERWGRRQIAAVRVEDRVDDRAEGSETSEADESAAEHDSDDAASERHLVALRD